MENRQPGFISGRPRDGKIRKNQMGLGRLRFALADFGGRRITGSSRKVFRWTNWTRKFRN